MSWKNMAHDDLTPEQDRDDIQDMSAPDAGAQSPDAELTPRERAMEIFRTRAYEGESLRMGQVLRRVRETLGLEIADVSRDTLMRKDYLMWIERMEVGELPRGGYLSAILNTYAKYLKLPEKDVIRVYSQECGAVEEVHSDAPVPKIGDIAPERSRWPLALAAATVLIALGAGAVGVSQMVRPSVELAPQTGVVAVNGARDSHEIRSPCPQEFAAGTGGRETGLAGSARRRRHDFPQPRHGRWRELFSSAAGWLDRFGPGWRCVRMACRRHYGRPARPRRRAGLFCQH
jgi:hypothetical protein